MADERLFARAVRLNQFLRQQGVASEFDIVTRRPGGFQVLWCDARGHDAQGYYRARDVHCWVSGDAVHIDMYDDGFRVVFHTMPPGDMAAICTRIGHTLWRMSHDLVDRCERQVGHLRELY